MKENPTDLNEPAWLLHRIRQLADLRQITADDQAIAAIDSLIEEAAERLRRLDPPRCSRPSM
jgi:hypothetical protein